MGERARRVAERRFRWDVVVDDMLRAYDRVLDRPVPVEAGA
jgi:hypothetical protein